MITSHENPEGIGDGSAVTRRSPHGKKDTRFTPSPLRGAALTTLIIFFIPMCAALGPWLSLSPGHAGNLYAFRLLILALGILHFRSVIHNHSSPRVFKVGLLLAALVTVFGSMSITWSLDVGGATIHLIGFLFQILAGLLLGYVAGQSSSRIRVLEAGLFFMGLVLCIMGIFEVATGFHLVGQVLEYWAFPPDAPAGPFVNPNNFAVFLFAAQGIFLKFMIEDDKPTIRVIALIAFFLAFYLIIKTTSVSTVALSSMFTIIAALYLVRRRGSVALMLIAAGISLAALTRLQPPAVQSDIEGSAAIRWRTMERAWELLVDSRGLGIGPRSFEALVDSRSSTVRGAIANVHNVFLEVPLAYGIVVGAAFVLLLAHLCFSELCAPAGRQPSARISRVAGIWVAASVVLAGLLASSVSADPLWWTLIGYLISRNWLRKTKEIGQSTPKLASMDLSSGSPEHRTEAF